MLLRGRTDRFRAAARPDCGWHRLRRGGAISDLVKTDRRDAVKLARFLRSGDLTEVHVPDVATEAMRDLERARDAAKRAERTARHQLGKFLLRHGRRYAGKTAGTRKHLD